MATSFASSVTPRARGSATATQTMTARAVPRDARAATASATHAGAKGRAHQRSRGVSRTSSSARRELATRALGGDAGAVAVVAAADGASDVAREDATMAREGEGARRGVTPGGGCGCLVWFVPGRAR